MMSLEATDVCTVCTKDSTRFCNRCKSARYCSTACQRDDWPTHKLLCANFAGFDASSRPTEDHFRAILLPVDESKPRVVWIQCKWRDSEDGRWQHPDVSPFLGPGVRVEGASIQDDEASKRKLSDTIYVYYRDNFQFDGSKANQCIAGVTATKPGLYHDWRGPVVAYGMVGAGMDQATCRDLDMTDFRHIASYLLSYGYQPPPAAQKSTGTKVKGASTKVKGVRVNCLGDQKMLNRPPFEAVEVSSQDAIFSDHDTSDIAARIGLPIFTRRCPPDPRWAVDQDGNTLFEGKSPFNNQDATFLHLSCDPKAYLDPPKGWAGWGWALMQYQSHVGSAMVVRQDKKPLSPLHVEALCKYCHYEIRPILAHTLGEYAPEEPMTKPAALAMINRPPFDIYWSKLLEEKQDEGADTDVPYPYDV